MLSSIARGLLALVWTYPLVSQICGSLALAAPTIALPVGPAIIDSNRSLLAALALGAFCFCGLSKSSNGKARWWGGLFLIQVLLASLFGGLPGDSFLFSLTWFAAGTTFLASEALLPESWDSKKKLLLVHLPLLLVAIAALLPVAMDADVLEVTGPFQIANVYSTWVLLLLPLVMLELKEHDSRSVLGFTILVLGVGIASLYLTNSRTSWILSNLELSMTLLVLQGLRSSRLLKWLGGLVVVYVLLFSVRSHLGGLGFLLSIAGVSSLPPLLEAFAFQRSKKELAGLLASLSIAAAVVFTILTIQPGEAFLNHTNSRMSNLAKGDNSTRSRLEFWTAAVRISNAHPLFGTGPNTFGKSYPQYQQHFYYYSDSPHCTTLELTSETGWVGGILFVGFVVTYLLAAKSEIRECSTRQMALLGILVGMAHAQVDVTYQFAEMWCILVVLLVVAGRREYSPASSPSNLKMLLCFLVLPILLYVAQSQRTFELSNLLRDDRSVYERALLASDRMPGWSRPALRALGTGLFLASNESSAAQKREFTQRLDELVRRVLDYAPASADAHRLAGEARLLQDRPDEAKALFSTAVKLDPYNYPLSYYGLMKVAIKTGDGKRAEELAHEVVERYPVEQLSLAHGSHQKSLRRHLVTLFFATADTLNPYQHPEKTEPLYRYLMENAKGARALHGLGVSLLRQGKVDEAYPLLVEAHNLNKFYPMPPPKSQIRGEEAP